MILNDKVIISIFLTCLLLFVFQPLVCQIEQESNKVEEIFSSSDDETISEQKAEELANLIEELAQNPININKADRNTLEKVYFLSDFQIQSLLDYRKKYGDFLSIYELSYVFGFDKEVVEKILPYIYIEGQYYPKRYNKTKHLLITKTEYKNNTEAIDGRLPIKIYNRYLMETNRLKVGMTMENDPNEAFFKETNKNGFDFYSGFLQYTPKGKSFKKLIIGDYSASFGQGLSLWGGYSMNKNINTTQTKKRQNGFRPFTSSNENLALRGVACTFDIANIELNVFASNKLKDANIKRDSLGQYFTGFQETGYHITESEIWDKNSLSEKTFGINISKETNWIKAGVTYFNLNYSAPFKGNDRLDTQFLPTGKEFNSLSFDAEIFLNRFVMFGEWAICENQSQAWLVGINQNLFFNTNISMLYRDYDRGYLGIHSSAFGENTQNRNEKGFYMGIENQSIPNLKLNAYADYFSFPWMTYYCDAPSLGNEKAIFVEYNLNRKVLISMKYKSELKERSLYIEEIDNTSKLEACNKNSARIQIRYWVGEKLQFTERVETSKYSFGEKSEQGFLIYHDMKYIFGKIPVTCYARYSMFQTESFETRIYQYENDLRYSFYVPFLYSQGSKYYFMLKYELKDFLDFYIKSEFFDYSEKEDVFIAKAQVVCKF